MCHVPEAVRVDLARRVATAAHPRAFVAAVDAGAVEAAGHAVEQRRDATLAVLGRDARTHYRATFRAAERWSLSSARAPLRATTQ